MELSCSLMDSDSKECEVAEFEWRDLTVWIEEDPGLWSTI